VRGNVALQAFCEARKKILDIFIGLLVGFISYSRRLGNEALGLNFAGAASSELTITCEDFEISLGQPHPR
jgi:hypothetical protein